MSNRKKLKKPPPNSRPRMDVILTQDNKKEVAKILGYSMETINDILAKAEEEGYKGVRLSTLPR